MAITKFVGEVWAAALLEAYHEGAVVTPLVTRDYEGEATKGNTVHITSITTPTIVDYKAAGRTINPQDLADTQVDLLIDQEKAFGFNVDDVDRVQAAGSFEPVTADAGAALVEDAESYVLGLMVANGTTDNGGAVVLDSASKAYSALKTMRTSLSKAKVPASQRIAVCNPDFTALLLDEASKLTSVNTAGTDGALRDAIIGRVLGFTVVESALLNPSKPTCVGFHKGGVAYVNQIAETEALRHQTKFADIVRGLHVYGAKVIRATSVRVYAGA